MITEYIKGDIVKLFLEGKNIAHGCNCFHTMGAGVAGQLAKAYPPILAIDKANSFEGDYDRLGNFTMATLDPNGNICFNLYTQFHPGPDLRYDALVSCCMALNNWGYNKIVPPVIYIPRIGCGIAGGDWEKVKVLIDMFTPNLNIIVVDWEE